MQLLLVLIFALVTSLLSTVVFYYGEPLAPGDFVAASDLPAAELRTPSFARTVERMPIYGEKLEAWLYMPLHVTKPPVIIMAPGLAAQKDFQGIEAFARRFVEEGWAVLLFDYRNFGGSDGKHRNLVHPVGHIQDYHAAIYYLVNAAVSEKVDVTRIALWGASLSGGHVLVTASQFESVTASFPINYIFDQKHESHNRTKPQIKAVFSGVPHLCPYAAAQHRDYLSVAKGLILAIADWIGSWFGLTVYIKVFGSPADVAILNTPESVEYGQLVPEKPLGGWVNKVPARSIFNMLLYRPMDYVPSITTPTLIIAAEKDSLCPIGAVWEAQKRLQNGKVTVFGGGHFDTYKGKPHFEESVKQQISFYREHLK